MSFRGSELFELADLHSGHQYRQAWQERLLVFVLLCVMVAWLSRLVFAIRAHLAITNIYRAADDSSGDEESAPQSQTPRHTRSDRID